jgi:nucleoside-diphosphate-sugar epimerase
MRPMKILLTGHHGYIGSLIGPFLRATGHDVVGLDAFFYELRGAKIRPKHLRRLIESGTLDEELRGLAAPAAPVA